MKKIQWTKRLFVFTLLLCVLAATLPLLPTASASVGVVTNGGFESGTTGWTANGTYVSSNSSYKNSGSYSMAVTVESGGYGQTVLSQVIQVTKDTVYTLDFTCARSKNSVSSALQYRVMMGASRSTQNTVGVALTAATAGWNNGLFGLGAKPSFSKNTAQFDTGNNTYIRIEFVIPSTGSHTNYVDDVTLTSSNTPPVITSFGSDTNRPRSASVNRIANGSFESADGAPWNVVDFMGGGLLTVVEDATAPDGDKVLYYDNPTATATWHTFEVSVEPNTAYIFSAWVRTPYLSAVNTAKASIGVVDPFTNGFAIYDHADYKGRVSTATEQIRSTATDNEWHLRSVQFTSGGNGKAIIGIYGVKSQMYFDDIALFKVSDGTTYKGERQTATISSSTSVANKYCEPGNSRIPDAGMNGKGAETFWTKESSGWRNGFMSFADSGDDHGRVIRYSSVSASNLYYFKWLKVEPGVSYTLSFDYKVTKRGAANTINLVDNNISLPKRFASVSLNTTNTGWQTYAVTFNPGIHTQIGFALQDKGGEVLIDDIRLFKTADGVATEPEQQEEPVLKPEGGRTSVLEMGADGLGVSFLMHLDATGVALDETHRLVLEDATVDAFADGGSYRLLRVGAVMTNRPAVGADPTAFTLGALDESDSVVDIPAVYGLAPDAQLGIAAGDAAYAVRIVRIPPAHKYTEIYARPYYVFEYAGREIVVYGDIYHRSYAEIPG